MEIYTLQSALKQCGKETSNHAKTKFKYGLCLGWSETLESGHICKTRFRFDVIVCEFTWRRAGRSYGEENKWYLVIYR
jgi:hypothetical protein